MKPAIKINKLLLFIIIFGLFYSCKKEKIEHHSYLTFNMGFIHKVINVWQDDSDCKDAIANQFNIDMDSYYNHYGTSTNPEIQNPVFYSFSYSLNNKSTLELKEVLELKTSFKDITIKDSLTFTKQLILKKETKELVKSNLELVLYQISKEDKSTWVLAKVIMKDIFENDNNILLPVFKYNYQINNDTIFSNFGYYYAIKQDNNYYKFQIELDNIHVKNNKVIYEDRSKKFLHLISKNNYNISVDYK